MRAFGILQFVFAAGISWITVESIVLTGLSLFDAESWDGHDDWFRPTYDFQCAIKVLHVKRLWKKQEFGKYFFFNATQLTPFWHNCFTELRKQTFDVDVYRYDQVKSKWQSSVRSGRVIVWKGVPEESAKYGGDAYGRFDPKRIAQEGDFENGDVLVINAQLMEVPISGATTGFRAHRDHPESVIEKAYDKKTSNEAKYCYLSNNGRSSPVKVYFELPKRATVHSVRLLNRNDEKYNEQNGLQIYVCDPNGKDKGFWNCRLCGEVSNAEMGGWTNLICPELLTGDRIKAIKTNMEPMPICEIKVLEPHASQMPILSATGFRGYFDVHYAIKSHDEDSTQNLRKCYSSDKGRYKHYTGKSNYKATATFTFKKAQVHSVQLLSTCKDKGDQYDTKVKENYRDQNGMRIEVCDKNKCQHCGTVENAIPGWDYTGNNSVFGAKLYAYNWKTIACPAYLVGTSIRTTAKSPNAALLICGIKVIGKRLVGPQAPQNLMKGNQKHGNMSLEWETEREHIDLGTRDVIMKAKLNPGEEETNATEWTTFQNVIFDDDTVLPGYAPSSYLLDMDQLPRMTKYLFKVFTQNNYGSSGYSNTIEVITPDTKPTHEMSGVEVKPATDGSSKIVVSWNHYPRSEFRTFDPEECHIKGTCCIQVLVEAFVQPDETKTLNESCVNPHNTSIQTGFEDLNAKTRYRVQVSFRNSVGATEKTDAEGHSAYPAKPRLPKILSDQPEDQPTAISVVFEAMSDQDLNGKFKNYMLLVKNENGTDVGWNIMDDSTDQNGTPVDYAKSATQVPDEDATVNENSAPESMVHPRGIVKLTVDGLKPSSRYTAVLIVNNEKYTTATEMPRKTAAIATTKITRKTTPIVTTMIPRKTGAIVTTKSPRKIAKYEKAAIYDAYYDPLGDNKHQNDWNNCATVVVSDHTTPVKFFFNAATVTSVRMPNHDKSSGMANFTVDVCLDINGGQLTCKRCGPAVKDVGESKWAVSQCGHTTGNRVYVRLAAGPLPASIQLCEVEVFTSSSSKESGDDRILGNVASDLPITSGDPSADDGIVKENRISTNIKNGSFSTSNEELPVRHLTTDDANPNKQVASFPTDDSNAGYTLDSSDSPIEN